MYVSIVYLQDLHEDDGGDDDDHHGLLKIEGTVPGFSAYCKPFSKLNVHKTGRETATWLWLKSSKLHQSSGSTVIAGLKYQL